MNNAAHEWSNEPMSPMKYSKFDEICLEEYGIEATFSGDRGVVELRSAVVVDEDKYIWFLLRFGVQ
jgi:hypothetical protein